MTQCSATIADCYPKIFDAKHIGGLVLYTANQLGKMLVDRL